MRARKYIPLFLLFTFLFSCVNVNAGNPEDSFIWVISNNRLVEQREHIVLDNEFFIFHSFDYISIKYYKGNETFFERSRQVGKMLKLTLHDGATLEIKHGNETILKTITCKKTFTNVLRYGLGIEFQRSIISILMAFILAIAVNVAHYYNLERRIL